ELPPGSDKAVSKQIEKAEAALRASEVELAKTLGYTLCQCTFPPQIMLWKEAEKSHVCPRPECGRRIEAAPIATPARAVENKGPRTTGVQCPHCGADTILLREKDHPHFAFAGWKTNTLKCVRCGKQTERIWKPDSGYS